MGVVRRARGGHQPVVPVVPLEEQLRNGARLEDDRARGEEEDGQAAEGVEGDHGEVVLERRVRRHPHLDLVGREGQLVKCTMRTDVHAGFL